MNNIEWKDGAVCYAYCNQFHVGSHYHQLVSDANHGCSLEQALKSTDFQLNEIKVGDYLPKSELDTEKKYNDVVEVFGLFGITCDSLSKYKGIESGEFNFMCIRNTGNGKLGYSNVNGGLDTKRKLTYNQIIAIGKLKRMVLEREKSNSTEIPNSSDQVKNPSHYQLIEGVESIEVIARSMTQEQFKGYCLGNTLKYRLRAGKKDALQQDIDKANFYGELYEMHKGKCYGN